MSIIQDLTKTDAGFAKVATAYAATLVHKGSRGHVVDGLATLTQELFVIPHWPSSLPFSYGSRTLEMAEAVFREARRMRSELSSSAQIGMFTWHTELAD